MIYLIFLLFIPLITSRWIDNRLEIYNGDDAVADEFPYIVSLRVLNKHICGGTLISPYWILTAAHCLGKCPKSYEVLFGSLESYNLERPPLKNLRNITRYIIHDKFKLGFFTHDIGLVQLDQNIILPNYVQLSDFPRPFDTTVTAAGWGLNANKTTARTLQKIELTVYSDKKCVEGVGKYYYPTTQMCAGSAKGRTCRGDSGGPILHNNVQYGLMTYNINGTCSIDIPVYFTKIVSLRSWIRQYARV